MKKQSKVIRTFEVRSDTSVEISAQEAVYLVLQMPLRRSSFKFQFINTSPPEDRIFLLKTPDKINELPDDFEDKESDSLIKRYARRPRQLEQLCLADFAAWYDYVRVDSEFEKNSMENMKSSASCADDLLPEQFMAETDEDHIPDDNTEPLSEELYLKCDMKLGKETM